ncbi:MAG: hypothetical protein IKT58_01175, partial [Oscillospiraceae bacterium]|nr:hypothetical protein [Oscillospiraceae bacterium]
TSTTLKEVYVDYLYYGPAEKAPSKLKTAGKDVTQVLSRGSVDNWELKTDNVDTADDQDFNPVNHRTYDMVIDRDSVPAEAFFVDFDGQGYGERYRDQFQYKGNNFDKESAWYSHNVRNEIYNTHTLDSKTGTMVLSNLKSKDANGNPLGAWIQTVVSGGDIGSTGVQLAAGKGHYAQIRFRVENCKSYAGDGNVSIFFSNSKDTETEGDVAKEERRAKVAVSNEEVLSGEFMTVTIPLDGTYYANSGTIDIMRVYIAGYTDNGTGSGRIIIDYIYVGPEQGMKQEIYGDYLYFGFTNTASDQFRYKGSVYGSTSSELKNYDTKGFWSSNTAGKDSACTIDVIDNDYLVFSDKASSTQYNFVHAGKLIKYSSFEAEEVIKYKLTGNDVFRIRFKITGNWSIYDNQTPGLSLEYAGGGRPAATVALNAELMDGEFHTLTMPMDTTQLKDDMAAGMTELNRVRINFSQIKDGVFTIDYIYVGPAELVESVTEKADYLFFDFTNNSAATTRYSNAAYGTYGKNFDIEGWHVNHTYSTPCLPTFSASAGTMSFKTIEQFYKDKKNTIPLATASECNFSKNHPLDFDLTGNEYFKVRMKIEGSTDTDANFRVTYADGPTSNNASIVSSFDRTIPATAIQNGEWFTLEGSIKFGSATKITALRFDVYNITMSASDKPITVTYDYIYVGPMEKANIAADSLYFGFDNDPEDQERYANHTYGG